MTSGTQTGAWDFETDLLVFGSGAGGLAASVFGAQHGWRVLLCEKSSQLGGTTATSGGMLWVPGNAHARRAGISDSIDQARCYLQHELGNYYRPDLVDAFLESGTKAIDALEIGSEVKFDLSASPDYHPDSPGGVEKGRSILTQPFDGRKLGKDFARVRPPMPRLLVLGGMMLGPDDLPAFTRPLASLANMLHVLRRVARYARDRLSYGRGTEISNGNALVARMFYSLRQTGADVWTDAPLVELIHQNGRVCGAIVERDGTKLRAGARYGVVLATGGFPHGAQLRDRYAGDYPHAHSMAFTGNTGDGLKAATAVGAAVDTNLAAPGLWTPASILKGRDGKDETIMYGYLDRGRPGVIAVNPDGKRFVNESNSYHDIVMAMFEQGVVANPNFYFICDARFVRKNGLGAIRPWPFSPSLKPFVDNGYITIADTLAELGNKLGISGDNLTATVRRHNEFAKTGRDLDFGKGSTAYNRIWGQADAGPNPNLTPIEEPPFVALRIIPATLGTTIGVKTDGNACVLDDTGAPIPGLYACGNELASAMRGFYPGGGVTLGPAIVFAYRAVEHAAESFKRKCA